MGDKGIGFSTAEYENRGWRLYLTSLIMILLAGVFVIARCCSRWWFSSFGWDDAVIVMSLVSETDNDNLPFAPISTTFGWDFGFLVLTSMSAYSASRLSSLLPSN